MNNGNMCRKLIVSALLGALVSCVSFAESFSQDQIREVLLNFRSYDYGKDPTPTHTVDKIVQFIADKPELRSFTEKQMIALLESDATFRAKQFICQQLWIIGSDQSVPVLEKMLLDPKTAEIACYALRSNPSDAVARALRRALHRVPAETQVRIINILGDREDAASLARLIELIDAEDADVAQAAAAALGKIGGDKATETIRRARAAASGDMHAVLTEAYLRCAEYYVRNRQPAKALAIYTALLDDSESLLTRRAALVGALHTGDSLAVDLMGAAIGAGEPVLGVAAIANSGALKGAEVTRRLITELKTAAPSTQVLLIEALAQRDDPLAKDAFTAVAGSTDAQVRIAAFNALGEAGDASTAAMLCNALKKAQTKPETDTVLASLRRMPGEQVSHAILGAIRDAPPSTQAQLIQVISDRGYDPAVPQLLRLCRSDETAVAKAALRAVGTLASHEAMPQLLDVLADRQDRTLKAEALRAAATVIGRSYSHRYNMARLVQKRLDDTTNVPARCSLLRLLSAVPNGMSLQRLEAASKNSNPSIRDAAVRSLAGYPDPAATDALLNIFQTSADSAHRAVALRGCVRLLKADRIPLERAVMLYEQLAARVSTPAEKKLILSGLALVGHPRALEIVDGFMTDDAVKAEAKLARDAIGRRLAEMSKPVALFDCKSFAGWEGDTAKTWRVEDGAITAGSLQERAPRNEFLATIHEYEDFELQLKFKITGSTNVNAGVQIRTKRIPNHHEVSGYQADIGPGVDGHLYDESRRRRMLASPDAETLKKAQAAVGDDGWQTYRIRATGNRIRLWLNGVKTVDYVEEDTTIPRTGIIALQIHGGMQAIIAYKDITIQQIR